MFANAKVLSLVIGLVACLAPSAAADGFGITFRKKGKQSQFGVQFTSGALCQPTPPPVACAPSVWVPGHHEVVLREVWVEGRQQKVWCAPRYEWRHDGCGRPIKVLVSPGHWQKTCTPGHYETRRVRIWEPGHWQSAACQVP